jgi:hypothetical protein
MTSVSPSFSLSVCVCVRACLQTFPGPRHGQHPDEFGETLRLILPILIACKKKAMLYAKHATVGVLWDFMSVPSGVDRGEALRAMDGVRT